MKALETIKSITVEWHEGDGHLDGKTFSSIETLQSRINRITPPELGYDKFKLRIELSNGERFVHRYDYGDLDELGRLISLRRDLEQFFEAIERSINAAA